MNYELCMDYCTSVRVEVLKDELLIKHNVPMLKIILHLQWRITQKFICWIADVLTYVHTYVRTMDHIEPKTLHHTRIDCNIM